MNKKETVLSILTNGHKSPHLKYFIGICSSIALTVFNTSRFRKEILINLNHSIEDIAIDLIGDLFKCENGKFIYFEKYYSAIDVKSAHEDLIYSKLICLISNRTKQRISEMREENGDIYNKIGKSVSVELKRNSEFYNQITLNEINFIFTCKENEIDFDLTSCPSEVLLESICNKHIKKYSNTNLMRLIFEFLNSQDEYCKAIEKKFLISVIKHFYLSKIEWFKFKSNDESINNVGYNNNSEDDL